MSKCIPGLKHLTTFNFSYHLMIYEQVKSSILNSILEIDRQPNLSIDEKCKRANYAQSLDILIESTFLQLYAELEETLYHECQKEDIDGGSGIKRFGKALAKQHYDTSVQNPYWLNLTRTSLIRNCLLHANGRLDLAKNAAHLKSTIRELNQSVSSEVILIQPLEGHRTGTEKLKLSEDFLFIFGLTCRSFIFSQKI